MRYLALERMEKAARRFKQEVVWGKVCVGGREGIVFWVSKEMGEWSSIPLQMVVGALCTLWIIRKLRVITLHCHKRTF